MKRLFIFCVIAFIALNNCVSTFVLTDSHTPLNRIKRHSGTFSPPTDTEKGTAQIAISNWDVDSALGTRTPRSRVFGHNNVRIDLQGVEYHEGVAFERYSVQTGDRTFATVHIEIGVAFGARTIRNAFNESMDHQSHVFLAEQRLNFSKPKDDFHYVHRKYQRSGNSKTWIYAALAAAIRMTQKNKV